MATAAAGNKYCGPCKCELLRCSRPRNKTKGLGRWCSSCFRLQPPISFDPHFNLLSNPAVGEHCPEGWPAALKFVARWAPALAWIPRADLADGLKETGRAFAGNCVPGERLDPVAVARVYIAVLVGGAGDVPYFGDRCEAVVSKAAQGAGEAAPVPDLPTLAAAFTTAFLETVANCCGRPRPNRRAHNAGAFGRQDRFVGLECNAKALGLLRLVEKGEKLPDSPPQAKAVSGGRLVWTGDRGPATAVFLKLLELATGAQLCWPAAGSHEEVAAFAKGLADLDKTLRTFCPPGLEKGLGGETGGYARKVFMRLVILYLAEREPACLRHFTLAEVAAWTPDCLAKCAQVTERWENLERIFAPLSPVLISMWACLAGQGLKEDLEVAMRMPVHLFFPILRKHETKMSHPPVDASDPVLPLALTELWRLGVETPVGQTALAAARKQLARCR